jgi:hypothetical protein
VCCKNPADHVFVDLDVNAKCQGNLLSNSFAAPSGGCAVSFQRPHRSIVSLGPWDRADGLVWGKIAAGTFAGSAFYENAAESRSLRRRPTACRPHHENARTGDNAIGRPKVGSPFPTSIQNQNLMSHQDEFGNHGPEATGLTKSDESDDCMQKKIENDAHAPDGINLKMLKNSIGLSNSPTTGTRSENCRRRTLFRTPALRSKRCGAQYSHSSNPRRLRAPQMWGGSS